MAINPKLRSTIVLAAVLCLSSCTSKTLSTRMPESKKIVAEGFVEANADNPGQQAEVRKSVVYGKYTVIDFTSQGCGACQEIKPMLEQLNASRPDIVVRSYDVNREGVNGIDWDSPLVAQYGLHSLPAFKIFNERGVLMAEGDSARDQVINVINGR